MVTEDKSRHGNEADLNRLVVWVPMCHGLGCWAVWSTLLTNQFLGIQWNTYISFNYDALIGQHANSIQRPGSYRYEERPESSYRHHELADALISSASLCIGFRRTRTAH